MSKPVFSDRASVSRSRSNERATSAKVRTASSDRPSSLARPSLIEAVVGPKVPEFRTEKANYIKELLSNLEKLNFPSIASLTQKVMQCPPIAVYIQIFKFLMEPIFVDQYKITQKHEEEIPYILKSLGYPYTVSKSSLLSIAPHTWPQLCHTLVWLSNSIIDIFEVKTIETFEVEAALASIITPQDDEQLVESLKVTVLKPLKDLIEETNSNYKMQLAELDRLNKEVVSDPADLESHIKRLESSIEQMKKFPDECLNYTSSKKDVILDLIAVNKNKQSCLHEKVILRNSLENQFKSQELVVDEVKKLENEEAKKLSDNKQIAANIRAIDEGIWELETKISKKTQNLEALCRQLNNQLLGLHVDEPHQLRLGLIPLKDQIAEYVHPMISRLEKTSLAEMEDLEKLESDKKDLEHRIRCNSQEIEQHQKRIDDIETQLRHAESRLTQKYQTLLKENRDYKEESSSLKNKCQALEDKIAQQQKRWILLDKKIKESEKHFEEDEKRLTKKLNDDIDQLTRLAMEREQRLMKINSALDVQIMEAELLLEDWSSLEKFASTVGLH